MLQLNINAFGVNFEELELIFQIIKVVLFFVIVFYGGEVFKVITFFVVKLIDLGFEPVKFDVELLFK